MPVRDGGAMDIDLVIRARAGDETAFDRLVEMSYGRLLAVAYRILRDRGLADDAAQHTLVEAWRSLPRLRDPARFERQLPPIKLVDTATTCR